jgi:poly(A) polymerase
MSEDQSLLSFLKEKSLFETEDESKRREEAMCSLNAILGKWAGGMGHSVRLLAFGSYRLGVSGPGGDMDVLCCAPRYIDRTMFFGSLVETLRVDPRITSIQVGGASGEGGFATVASGERGFAMRHKVTNRPCRRRMCHC